MANVELKTGKRRSGHRWVGTREAPTDTKPKVEKKKKAYECPFKVPDKFLTHPGGQEMLKLARGSKRPDTLFLSCHAGYDLDGKVAAECKARGIEMPKRGPIFNEIHEAMLKVRREHPEQEWIHFFWLLIVSVMNIYGLALTTYNPTFLNCIHCAFWLMAHAFGIFHTRNHKGDMHLYKVWWLDGFWTPIYDFIESVWMIPPYRWRIEHNIEHHLYTNSDIDSDIYMLYPFFRFHREQQKLWFHSWQSWYAPVLAILSGIRLPAENLEMELDTCKPEDRWKWQAIFGIWLVWALSFLRFGLAGVGLFFWLYTLVGLMNYYWNQVSHNHNSLGNKAESDWETIDEWIRIQMEESISWGGYFTTLYGGALNLQNEHHLMPTADATLYYFLMPELRRICKKYDIPYNYSSNFFTACWEHHQFLWTMGNM